MIIIILSFDIAPFPYKHAQRRIETFHGARCDGLYKCCYYIGRDIKNNCCAENLKKVSFIVYME